MLNLQGTLSDPQLCAALIERIHQLAAHPKLQGKPFRFMEVCGTHTVALFRSGVISMLPTNIVHLSGPGCPVCVTHDSEIAAAISLAERQGKDSHRAKGDQRPNYAQVSGTSDRRSRWIRTFASFLASYPVFEAFVVVL